MACEQSASHNAGVKVQTKLAFNVCQSVFRAANLARRRVEPSAPCDYSGGRPWKRLKTGWLLGNGDWPSGSAHSRFNLPQDVGCLSPFPNNPESDSGNGTSLHILLTNDDGIYAPGLAAIERELCRLGDVCVVAPTTEQSGVGHSITYLTPLIVKEVFDGDNRWGWAVEGSPADCVRIAIAELCSWRPDLVVSGINSGLNVGINVLYSGTVAAAIEGAFFGITSMAVSLEFAEHAQYEKAARLAREIIQQVLDNKGPAPQLYNFNIPTAALTGDPRLRIVPMDVAHYGERFEKRSILGGELTTGRPANRRRHWANAKPT